MNALYLAANPDPRVIEYLEGKQWHVTSMQTMTDFFRQARTLDTDTAFIGYLNDNRYNDPSRMVLEVFESSGHRISNFVPMFSNPELNRRMLNNWKEKEKGALGLGEGETFKAQIIGFGKGSNALNPLGLFKQPKIIWGFTVESAFRHLNDQITRLSKGSRERL